MKFKLLPILLASFTVISCNNDKADKNDGAGTSEAEAKPSKVSESFAAVAKKFDGEKYVSTQIAHKTDYFILYYTASW